MDFFAFQGLGTVVFTQRELGELLDLEVGAGERARSADEAFGGAEKRLNVIVRIHFGRKLKQRLHLAGKSKSANSITTLCFTLLANAWYTLFH